MRQGRNEAHLRCMKNEAELRSMKRTCGTRKVRCVLQFMCEAQFMPKAIHDRRSIHFIPNKKALTKWVMFLAENLKISPSASIAFSCSNTLWVSQ